jgi:hypothetical protein
MSHEVVEGPIWTGPLVRGSRQDKGIPNGISFFPNKTKKGSAISTILK